MTLSVKNNNKFGTFFSGGTAGGVGRSIYGYLALKEKMVANEVCKLFANFYRAQLCEKDHKEHEEQLTAKYTQIYGQGFFEIISLEAVRKLPVLRVDLAKIQIRDLDEQMRKENISLARLPSYLLVARIEVIEPKSKHLMVFNLKSYTTWTFTKSGLNTSSGDCHDQLDEPRRRFFTQLIQGKPCIAFEFHIKISEMLVRKSLFSSEQVPNIHLAPCEKLEKKSDKKDKT